MPEAPDAPGAAGGMPPVPGPGDASAPGYPPPGYPPPGYPPAAGYPSAPGYPPTPGYAAAPGYAPAPGYQAAPVYGYAMPPPVTLNPALVTALPIEERTYPAFYRTPRLRWWRPIVAALAVGFVALLAMAIPAVIGMVIDGADFVQMAQTGTFSLGPWGFLGNNVGLALLIPIAMLGQWLFFGQRPGWMSSVVGRFRWGWFARCVAVVLPIWLIMLGVETALVGLPTDLAWRPTSGLMIVGILLTTPLQSAGEEYLMRGLEQRLVASYFRADILGWIVATVVSSVTFMRLHGADDPWLNLYYFSFGVAASWIGWKTGGLEASVAVHVVNNLLSEALMPWTDFSGMFERGVGTADATILIQVAVMTVAVVLIWWVGKRSKVVVRSAPGREEIARAEAQAAAAWGGRPTW